MHISLKATVPFFVCGFASVLPLFGHESDVQLPFVRPQVFALPEGHAHLGWESRYFTEGRDALDGDSLFAGSIEAGWEHLSGGIWYGHSPDQDYDELHLSVALSQSIGSFDFYLGYTHLRFPFDGSHDNEIGTGFAWSGLPLDIELTADVYYSFVAEGYFAEIAAGREFAITDDIALNVSVPFGINQGYVADGHDGANHIALRVGLEYALTDSISVTAHATQSWAIDSDVLSPGDDLLIDLFHAGVGLEWSF